MTLSIRPIGRRPFLIQTRRVGLGLVWRKESDNGGCQGDLVFERAESNSNSGTWVRALVALRRVSVNYEGG